MIPNIRRMLFCLAAATLLTLVAGTGLAQKKPPKLDEPAAQRATKPAPQKTPPLTAPEPAPAPPSADIESGRRVIVAPPVTRTPRPAPSERPQIAPPPQAGLHPGDAGESRRPVAKLSLGGVVDVNGSPAVALVAEGETATVSWDMSATAAQGIILRVHDAPFTTPCSDDLESFEDHGTPDFGFHPTAAGSHQLDLSDPYYTVGTSYYVHACGWGTGIGVSGTGFAGVFTNVVELRYGEEGSGSTLVQLNPTPPPMPAVTDLVVESLHLENDRVSYRITNLGAVSSAAFQVRVDYHRQSSFAAHPFYSQTIAEAGVAGLSSRERVTDIQLEHPNLVTVSADSEEAVQESEEWNNVRETLLTPGLPDFKVRNVTRHQNNGPSVRVDFDVKNIGSFAAPGYAIRYRVGPNDEIAFENHAGLAPGSHRDHSISSDLPVGANELKIQVEAPEGVYEERSDNNVAGKWYTKVPAAGLADLKIRNLNRHANNSDNVHFTWKVKNIGSAASPSYRIRTRADAVDLYELSYGALDPGQERQHDIQAEALETGDHTFHLWVDPDGAIAELSESNNYESRNYRKD